TRSMTSQSGWSTMPGRGGDMGGDAGEAASFDWCEEEPLTCSERVVLAVLARRARVGEAAETLGWSEREVCAQLASASRKLGAHSGLEALLNAARRGEIRRPVLG